MIRLCSCLFLILLPGCATVVSGANQVVSVSTSPPGATCSIDRGGALVGSVPSTPGVLPIGKSGRDLTVTCTKPGYQTARTVSASSFNGWTFGNLVVGGLIGVAIDASTGANFDYPPLIDVAMLPDPASARPSSASPLAEAPDRQLITTRMMRLPENSPAKRSFLLGACSAGDMTACILAGDGRPGSPQPNPRTF